MKTLKSLTILITLLFFTSGSFAADETIEMLNKLEKEIKGGKFKTKKQR